jgi:hypothetical protein
LNDHPSTKEYAMRLMILAVLAIFAVCPAFAQQISPMTGTTSTAPVAPPAPAHPAAGRHRMTMQQRFDAANTSKDGKLTLEQAKAAKLTRVVRNFDAMDSAKKGYVTMDDWHAFNRAQRAARKAAAPKP